MTENKLSTAEVLELLKVERGTLLHHVHLLRGLLNVTKDRQGRFKFTEAQVEILKRHFRDFRRAAHAPPDDDSDEIVRYQERIRQVRGIRRELTTLVKDMGRLLGDLGKPPVASATIYTLPQPDYQLVRPVRVLLYPFRRCFRASLPEARLQVQEATRENALLALRADLLRAYIDLPPSPPTDDPQVSERWHVLHTLIVPPSEDEEIKHA